jgi:hypothetical protein
MQWFSFRTVVRIFLGLVTQLVSGEVFLGLVAAIDDRDMRLNVALLSFAAHKEFGLNPIGC